MSCEGKKIHYSVFQYLRMINCEPEVCVDFTGMIVIVIHAAITFDGISQFGSHAFASRLTI